MTTIPRKKMRGRAATNIPEYLFSSIIIIGILSIALMYERSYDSRITANAQAQGLKIAADAAVRYINANYTAFIPDTPTMGASGQTTYVFHCNYATYGNCNLPSVLGNTTQTFQQSGLIPLYFSGAYRSPSLVQPYLLIVTANAGPDKATYLHAIVATTGTPAPDTNNYAVSHLLANSAFIPLGTTIGTIPAWVTAYGRYNGVLTPGHIAINIDTRINGPATSSAISRYSRADTRQNTLGSTLYMGKDIARNQGANICFCPPDNDYYQGACRVPNTSSIPDTPSSPNYCRKH